MKIAAAQNPISNFGGDPAADKLQELERAVLTLSPSEQAELSDWLENLLEDRLEMTDEFKAEIEAGKAEIHAGVVRVRRP